MVNKIKYNIKHFVTLTEKMTTCFYQQDPKRGFELYDEVLDALLNTMDELTYLNSQQVISFDITKMNTKLEKAMTAIMNKDTILFSDIMNFEIVQEVKTYYNTL